MTFLHNPDKNENPTFSTDRVRDQGELFKSTGDFSVRGGEVTCEPRGIAYRRQPVSGFAGIAICGTCYKVKPYPLKEDIRYDNNAGKWR